MAAGDPKFSDELMEFARGAVLLPTELAGLIEKQFGIEVGTKKSLEMIRLSLEHYIDQTTEAVKLLDSDRHMVAKICLDNIIKYFREALSDVNRQLRTGDHLPDKPS